MLSNLVRLACYSAPAAVRPSSFSLLPSYGSLRRFSRFHEDLFIQDTASTSSSRRPGVAARALTLGGVSVHAGFHKIRFESSNEHCLCFRCCPVLSCPSCVSVRPAEPPLVSCLRLSPRHIHIRIGDSMWVWLPLDSCVARAGEIAGGGTPRRVFA